MKIGRNDPCLCVSGKKYKDCCLNKPNYEALYFEQIELLKNPTIENCQKVIALGNTILEATVKYVFSTGACVNIARANLFLLYDTNKKEFIDAAKAACDKALVLKQENQQALLVRYEINIFETDFTSASRVLESIHPSILKQAEMQILMFYQQAVQKANIYVHSQKNKDGLNILTDTLFEIYKNYPPLCGSATSYYMGIGDDIVRAYEVAKRCVEEWPNAEIYCNLGLICINPQINRVKEAITYLKKGLDICSDGDVEYGLKSNLLTAFIKDKNWPEAIKLGEELVRDKPSNLNYHNYAELLKSTGQYDEAIEWCKKALFLVEDDCTLLTLADIYKRNAKYQDAIDTYLLCLSSQENNNNCLTFIDENGDDMYSVASNSSIYSIKLEAFKGLVHASVQLKSYDKAKAYMVLGKELLGEQDEWEIWESVIPTLDNFSQAYNEAKALIEEATNRAKTQTNYFKQWAASLMQLQGNSQYINLNELDNWAEFEAQMGLILEEMKKVIINHSTLYSSIEAQIISQYPNLDSDSKEFLITANILYDIHKNSFIDFAPIIVEYSKVVEKRLRVLLAGRIPSNIKMLGEIIVEIDKHSIVPYNAYLGDLRSINQLRRNSAHTGRLAKTDADNMRNILFTNGLLNRL
ncbi:anaphase-promoting complex subunit 3 [Anaerobacterium chartisolvens]|uniref:Anaphase-promoting complex subunit 3 n=1 Tax=Anaerobacterium chartisolvens TaxID=1297424 RepID=A0A369AJR6_9FIRM|nr:CDC27 family protein [Anaerobacterium chartisolvens]RCX09315.1 anaphase-promoting complex subunit 3 [Anaerobacterium chartisolvens]